MLMGFNGTNNIDIDRLTTMLEENRTLLNDMATKEVNCSDGATLPKLLFELVQQAALENNSSSVEFILDDSTSSTTTEKCITEHDEVHDTEEVENVQGYGIHFWGSDKKLN